MDIDLSEILRKCIQLIVGNRSMNKVLTIMLEHIVKSTGNNQGFIAEKRNRLIDNDIYYRYHAVTGDFTTIVTNSYMTEYLSKGYFDLSHEHAMHKDINMGEIHINNSPKEIPCPHHPRIKKTIFFPLHDTNNSVIGLLGLAGSQDFTQEIGASYKPYVEICSYILQLAIERNNINHHKNCFLYNVSTALRKPIDGILCVSKVTNNTTLTNAQKQYIDVLTFYSMKLLDIVNDIQDYTKMVLGSLHLVNKNMNLKGCLDTVLLITQQKIKSPDVDLEYQSGEVPEIILADEVRVTQILVNILDNACRYTSKGKVILSVKSEPSSNNGYNLKFEIRDTGAGMTPEHVHNIFGGLSMRSNNEGVGLGLLIVKYLIEMFGGNIAITSKVGEGTTVKFNIYVGQKQVLAKEQIAGYFKDSYALLFGTDLNTGVISEQLNVYGIKSVIASSFKDYKAIAKQTPARKRCSLIIFGQTSEVERHSVLKHITVSKGLKIINTVKHIGSWAEEDDEYFLPTHDIKENLTDTLVMIIKDAKDHTHTGTGRGRILVAEDNKESRELLVDLLKRLGYNVIDTVNDGLELYVKLTSKECPEYEIIFVSVTIGVLDGYTAIKRYKQTEAKDVPKLIIGMVPNSITTEGKDLCYASGMNGYIIKPINIKDLERLDTFLPATRGANY